MKKILSLALILSVLVTSLFIFASCGDDEGPQTDPIDAFVAVTNSVKATKVVTLVEVVDVSGEKLGGSYSTEIEGENSISAYEFKTYRSVDEGADDFDGEGEISRFKVIKGTVYYKDGKTSYDGDEWVVDDPVAFNLTVKLDKAYLVDAKISEDGTTLTAKVSAENAKKLLGTDIGAAGDVEIVIAKSSTRLTSISVYCTTQNGSSMSVRSSYSYNPIVLDFTAAE